MADEKRLIDANKLQHLLLPIATGLEHEYGSLGGAVSGVMKHIDSAPTVDATEVVHGRWIWKDGKCFCSACKEHGEPKCIEPDGCVEEYPYCPNCGAKMDEEMKFVGICEHCVYCDECDWPKLHPKIKLKECPDFSEGDHK